MGSPLRASILSTVCPVLRLTTGIVAPASLPAPAVKICTSPAAATRAAASASPLRLSPSPTSRITRVWAGVVSSSASDCVIAAATSVPGRSARSPGRIVSMISRAVFRSRVRGKRTSASPA